jgi:hypothetical protein
LQPERKVVASYRPLTGALAEAAFDRLWGGEPKAASGNADTKPTASPIVQTFGRRFFP